MHSFFFLRVTLFIQITSIFHSFVYFCITKGPPNLFYIATFYSSVTYHFRSCPFSLKMVQNPSIIKKTFAAARNQYHLSSRTSTVRQMVTKLWVISSTRTAIAFITCTNESFLLEISESVSNSTASMSLFPSAVIFFLRVNQVKCQKILCSNNKFKNIILIKNKVFCKSSRRAPAVYFPFCVTLVQMMNSSLYEPTLQAM